MFFTPRPDILTLPREVRDIVYSFLTVNVEMRADFTIHGVSGVLVLAVSVPRAPVLHCLEVYPQQEGEYSHSPAFKNSSVILQVRTRSYRFDCSPQYTTSYVKLNGRRQGVPNSTVEKLVPTYLRHARHLKLLIADRKRERLTADIDAMRPIVPNLQTLRLQYPLEFMGYQPNIYKDEAPTTPISNPQPDQWTPDCLIGLPLA
ncbi:hypothetical protein P154DRAFT_596216 [Amniculicola lignicola CBS 123094]|uniref:Uncharacterized protein n=1 Tax=Amniculicola lignicola CBS 123094 TaxID=1392246 RepID=A0A6A5WR86_9PLEO|nr:hypothetical protein P154DRAFT_596216 [Amniculicola lignicola CBS 123094]